MSTYAGKTCTWGSYSNEQYKDALNALCGAMIAAHVAAQAADLPNREAAFRELLLALGKDPAQP